MDRHCDHYRKVMDLPVDPSDKGAPGTEERLQFSRKLVNKYVGDVLEIGPANRAVTVHGVLFDINKKFLMSYPGRERIQGDFTYLPFRDSSFDVVVWLEGPEHSMCPDIVLQQIKQLLRDGGHLIVSCPESPFLDDDWQHVTHFKEHDLYTLLSKYFTVLNLHRVSRFLIGECVKI